MVRLAASVAALLFVIGIALIPSTNGCGTGESDKDTILNIKLFGTKLRYVRCVAGTSSSCRVNCNTISGEIQVPETLTFQNLTVCLNWKEFYICYTDANDLSTYSCVQIGNTTTQCPPPSQRLSTLSYKDADTCDANLPTTFVICGDSKNANTFTCQPNNPGCTTGTLTTVTTAQFPVSSFTADGTCTSTIANADYQRCIPVAGSGVTTVQCVVGQPVAAVCPAGTTLADEPATTGFDTSALCNSYVGDVQCYSSSTNTYACRSDVTGCQPGETQVTGSISAATCPADPTQPASTITSFVRCTTTSGVECRPAETVTFQSGTVATATPISPPCSSVESLLPPTTFSSDTACEAYVGKEYCYSYSTNTVVCVDDYTCLGADKKVITQVQTNDPTQCAAYSETTNFRCVDATGTVTCRPSEAGCAPGETQTPATTFPSENSCDIFVVVPQTTIRCEAPNGTPYCSSESCNIGDSRLQETGTTTTFADSSACNSALFWTHICYTALSTPDATTGLYYTIAISSDTSGGTCPGGSLTLSTWMSSNTAPTVNDAYTFYQNLNPIQHHRCNVGGVPVCRPDMDPSTTGVQDCFGSEAILQSDPSWMTLSQCNSQLYYAVPCYKATTTDPYYQIVPGYDTTTPTAGTCAPGELKLSNTYYPASSTTAATAAVAATYTPDTNLPTYRCNEGGQAVCRPDMDTTTAGVQCAGTETLAAATATPAPVMYNNLRDCQQQLYAGEACYTATTSPPYYTITAGLDTATPPGSCTSPAVSVPQLPNYYLGSSTAAVDALAKAAYDAATVPHFRCNKAGTVICRPDQTPTTPTGDCPSGETLLTSSNAEFPTATFADYQTCVNNIYFGVPCYNALSFAGADGEFYTIVAGLDTTAGFCAGGQAKLVATFYSAKAQPDLDAAVAAYYTDNAPVVHYRCKVGNMPVCRPDMSTASGIQCFSSEILAPATASTPKSYATLGLCETELYWGKPCYVPDQNNGEPYYKIVGALDTDVIPGTCLTPASALAGLTSYLPGATTAAVNANGKSLYEATTTIPHVRCKYGFTPVCRPAACVSSPSADAPFVETQLTTAANTGPDFTSLSNCLSSRYFSLLCYNANLPDPSQTTCNSDAVGCSSGFISIKTFGGESTTTDAGNDCTNDATAMWSRCGKTDGSGSRALCRPSSVCLPDETRLYRRTQLVTKNTCPTTTAYIICYDTTSIANEGTQTSPFTCTNDYKLCAGTKIRYPLASTADSVSLTPYAVCPPAGTVTTYFRCETTSYVICRPSDVGCYTATETKVLASYASVKLCLDADTTYCSCSFAGCKVRGASGCCTGGGDGAQIPNDSTFYKASNCI